MNLLLCRHVLGFLLLIMLVSCHSVKQHALVAPAKKKPTSSSSTLSTPSALEKKRLQDGPPLKPLIIKAADAIPSSEPFSRYGNPGAYQVDGKTYEVMTTAKGYHARGVASWYGTKFHSQRTSSGEPYDLYGMTAAHKTLPLPTYVKVKNLKNGREVIVKVNDRGPFHSDRIIDLSYGAASKLGLLPTGTAPVEVTALSTNKLRHGNDARYYLQVGAFSSKPLAEALQAQLRQWIKTPIQIEQHAPFFIVKTGPFENKLKADNLKLALSQRGLRGVFYFLE